MSKQSGVQSARWVAVYCYDTALTPRADTTLLCTALTMVSMSHADYSLVDNLNVSMIGYACGTESMELENVWKAIGQNYGV